MENTIDMKDKIVVVTGPTSGIGKQVALDLAAKGATLVLACRDVGRGEAALADIARRSATDELSVMELDSSSQASIREFAARFKQRHERLDVLVNNAGVNLRTRQESVDGIELVFATNVLGYHRLTHELLDVLRASSPARIVNVASTFAGNLDLDDLEFKRRRYDPIKAYQQSKACNRLLTWALSRRLEGSGVTANAMSPGLVATGLYRDTPLPIRALLRVVGLVRGRSVEAGADTAVWLAASPEVAGVSAKMFELRKELACQFRDEQTEERLWHICEPWLGGS
jgi:NAD(P)-dependent dehydrogenase (short-subunit alcohol dehydrogenase family)